MELNAVQESHTPPVSTMGAVASFFALGNHHIPLKIQVNIQIKNVLSFCNVQEIEQFTDTCK